MTLLLLLPHDIYFERGLFRSTDGQNWSRCWSGAISNPSTVYQSSAGYMLVGGLNRISRSDDGFQTVPATVWTNPSATDCGVTLFYEPPGGTPEGAYVFAGYLTYLNASLELAGTGSIMRATRDDLFNANDWQLCFDLPVNTREALGIVRASDNYYYIASAAYGGLIRARALAPATGTPYDVVSFDLPEVTTTAIMDLPYRTGTGYVRHTVLVGAIDDEPSQPEYPSGHLWELSGIGLKIGSPLGFDPITIANKHTRNQLTSVIGDVEAGLVYYFPQHTDSTDVYPLLGDPSASHDTWGRTAPGRKMYFGATYTPERDNPHHGNFANLVFNISQGGLGNYTIKWAYLAKDGTWKELVTPELGGTLRDETVHFKKVGVGRVSWEPPADWDPNGSFTLTTPTLAGYWICAELVDWSLQLPLQKGMLYTCATSYIDVHGVKGDIAALGSLRVGVSGDWVNRVIVCQRGIERGDAYTPYLNLSTYLPPYGVTVIAPGTSGQYGTMVLDPLAPTGYDCLEGSNQGVNATSSKKNAWVDVGTMKLASSVMSQYYGVHRLYLRYRATGTVQGTVQVRLKLQSGSGQSYVYSEEDVISGNPWTFSLANLGRMTIPTSAAVIQEDIAEDLSIVIQIKSDVDASRVRFYDILLMPVDEWNGNFYDKAFLEESKAKQGTTLEIDSATSRLNYLRSVIKNTQNQVRSVWQPVTAGEFKVKDNARLWFLSGRYQYAGQLVLPTLVLLKGSITALAFSESGFGAAVSEDGYVYQFSPNTLTWSEIGRATVVGEEEATHLWGTDYDNETIYFIGTHSDDRQTVIWRYANSAWSLSGSLMGGIPPGESYQDIGVTLKAIAVYKNANGDTDGWALGNRSYRFNGAMWTEKRRAGGAANTQTIEAVHMLSAKLGFAVGGKRLYKFDDEWRKLDNEDAADMYRIRWKNTNDRNGWAVGKNGAMYKCINGKWARTSSPTTSTLNGLALKYSTTTRYVMYAVGGTPSGSTAGTSSVEPLILKYTSSDNGSDGSWKRQTVQLADPIAEGDPPILANSTLQNVHFATDLAGVAVGSGGTVYVTTDGGTTWKDISVILHGGVNLKVDMTACWSWLIDGNLHARVLGAGVGYHINWNGTTWICTDTPMDSASTIHAISSDGTRAWAVGDNGVILLLTDEHWIVYDSPAIEKLWDVTSFDTEAYQTFAVGEYGTIVRWTGSAWEKLSWDIGSEPTLKHLYGVAADGLGRFGAVGEGGVTLYYDDSWQEIGQVRSVALLQGLYMEDENEGWLVGYPADIWRYSWGTLEQVDSPWNDTIYDIAKIAGILVIVGKHGVAQYANGEWTEIGTTESSNDFYQAIAAASKTDGWIGGKRAGTGIIRHWLAPSWDWNPSTLIGSAQLSVQPRYLSMRGEDEPYVPDTEEGV